jgi:hypothetical protein
MTEPTRPPTGSGDGALGRFVGFGCLLPIGIATLLLVIVISIPRDSGPGVGGAIRACENAVEDMLRAPATAQFNSSASGDNPWTVVGTVDAENGFGATVRAEYECTVRGSRATVDYFSG